ncbi:fibronectin type III domain-containing protein [Lachnospiraceae bacterium MD308]|nr:fibronectin type III domain-containing protein [Lachnospiraceae bacterium MD308]
MFKAIYMGHNQGNDNKKPYNGNAVLNLDAKVTVRENIVTSGNSKAAINISGGANQAAQAKKFYGNENTTLTVDSPLVENAVLDNIGNVVLRNGACLSPETESLCNVTLQSGACLDLNDVYNAVITGDFTGETDAAKEKGILVLNREGCLRINGKITGTTQFQTEHRNTPGILLPDRAYIIADREKATESNFVLTQNSIENGHELKYSDGVWKTAPLILREIGRIEILSAPSEVDLAKISMYDEEKISEGDPYFEVEWYDKEGNIFDDSEVEDNLFYEIGQVLCIRTEYWKNNTEDILQKNDWMQWVTLSSLEGYSGRYYIQKYGNMATTGDYTFLFLSSPYELEQLDTVADVKALQNEVMAERRVIFYNGDTGETEKPEPEKPEHTHSYQSAVTKEATCTEKGIRTYTCSCGNTYTESIEAAGHKPVTDPAVAPTETTAGKTEGSHCSVCKEVLKKQEAIPALGKPEHTHSYQSAVTKEATCTEKGIRTYTCSCGNKYTEELAVLSHKYIVKVSPATVKNNGKIQQSCQVCSAAGSASVIYKPRKLTLNKTDFSYDGKVKTPSVTVKDSQGNSLRKGTDYQIKYPKGRKNPGVYSVAIVLQGNYSGKMTGSFTIRPKKTSLKKVAAKSKGMQVTWNKQAAQIDGYQIQYCTSAKFKGKTLKAVTVKKNSTVKKISKLAGKKKYYVRIRTYKTVKVNGKSKKLYSDWSGKKAVNTKK